MSLSPEVQAAADEIRRNKSLVKSLQAERDLWKKKANESASALDAMAKKDELSADDRTELKRQRDELDALNDELEGAAQDNTKPDPISQPGQLDGLQPIREPVKAEEIPDDPDGARPDPLPGTARGDGAPLMPNMAFDPDPTGNKGRGTDGQPNQPAAIETAGGFVVSGGGTTQRAPGSMPDLPSSSVVPDETLPEPTGVPAYQQDGIPPMTADEAAAAQAKYDAEQQAKIDVAAAKEAKDKADAANAKADFPS